MIAWTYLDKKAAAVEALKDYAAMSYIIQNHKDAVSEVCESMTSVRSSVPTETPRTPNPHAGETRLATAIDEIDILKERYRQALEYMEWFSPAWDALADDERFVLTEFYWEYEKKQIDTIGNICDRFHIERSSAYKKKNRALEKLSTLLYGK